jgi:hypothetical protein
MRFLEVEKRLLSSCLVTDEAARPGLIDLRVVLPDLDDPSGLNDHWPPVFFKIFGQIDQENSALIFPFLYSVRGENV